MKARSPICLVFCCALIQCAGYAFVSNPARQGTANSTTSTNNRLSNDERTMPLIETKNQGTASHQPKHNKSVSSKIPLPTDANKARTSRSKVVRNRQSLKSRYLAHDPQPSSFKPIAARKAVNHNLPIHPVAGSTIGVGNFRNRHLPPIAEGVGGPARIRRNTATLSGTGMGRKR